MPLPLAAETIATPVTSVPWPTRCGAVEGPSRAVAWEVAKLLAIADNALDDDDKVARAYIARAATLLLTTHAAPKEGTQPAAEAGNDPSVALAPWQLKRVVAFVEEHLAEPIKVGALATVAKLGASHFSRAFKGSIGRTPHTYLMERRIERAKLLMLDTEQPLSQIALDCGMSDQAHLSRLFRRFVGVGPMAWRRARRTVALPKRASAEPQLSIA